jgi:membrane protein DedA with SNARE-associated domain
MALSVNPVDFSAARTHLLQQVNLFSIFFCSRILAFFLFISELLDLFVAGRDHSATVTPG